MMTLEHAAKIVSEYQGKWPEFARETFITFVEVFDLKDDAITDFAIMCGFPIAVNLVRIKT